MTVKRKKKPDRGSLNGRYARCTNCGTRGRVNPWITRARTVPACSQCKGKK